MAGDAMWGAPDAPPLPSPEVMRVIRFSAALLAEREDTFVRQLHSEVTALIPGLASNGRVFCERMVRSLLWAAAAGQSPYAAADALRQVGAANRRDGFPEARYVDVARALVLAVRNVSGNSWDNSIGSAWISYFRWAEPHLRAGARQAAAEQAAAQESAAEADPEPAADLLDVHDLKEFPYPLWKILQDHEWAGQWRRYAAKSGWRGRGLAARRTPAGAGRCARARRSARGRRRRPGPPGRVPARAAGRPGSAA